MEPDFNLDVINWRTREGQPATAEDGWAWAFAYTKEGQHMAETRELVEAIKRHVSVKTGGFEIKLGGRDGKLLNPKRIKA